MSYKKKLIEVALPLDAINQASAREKSIRHGHPSTLHLWWSRKPLATCRAVLFATLVDDPSSHPDRFPTEADQEKERKRLFGIIEELVKWENTNNEEVLAKARKEIMKATNNNPPPVYDPFCGGGSIPLEAQRLGLAAYASDLNPVAVLITKALIEIPPRFAGRAPVNPEARRQIGAGQGWQGAAGLAADVRYYGEWMRREAAKRIGHLYPKVKLPPEHGGGEATVIAWLWARTVRCPNPACGWEMPLASKFWLSTKKGKEAWVEPVVDGAVKQVRFVVKTGKGKPPEGTVSRRGAKCICCGTPVAFDYIRGEGQAGRMGVRLMAIVAEGRNGRVYVGPDEEHVQTALAARPQNVPDTDLPEKALGFRVQQYGMTKHKDLFTPRQLVALTTFSDLVAAAREQVYQDAVAAGMADDGTRLNDGGAGAAAYADAVATYLALAVDKGADYWSSMCSWHTSGEKMRNTFGRQAIPMVWDYAECCPFSTSTGNWTACVDWVWKVIHQLGSRILGKVYQLDATEPNFGFSAIISTDPPYYDNIGYADLSDFFYVWLRRALHGIYPDIFSTVLVPKAPELVATPYRFGGDKDKAKAFFEHGLGAAFATMRQMAHPDYPLTVYYAFKQADTEAGDEGAETHGSTASTGWETMLEGLLKAGFVITGTWPMRSELSNRPVANGTNALASSIVLVCRPRPNDAPLATRREFLSALRRELPQALHELQQGSIAPVDMAQCAIGPGMAIFSRYKRVLEADGQPMPVRTALALINQELDAYLAAQEGAMDEDTRFCAAWFEQFGLGEAPFGEADVLARAKNTAVDRLVSDGILAAAKGKVRLIKRDELADFSPEHDSRLTVWRSAQQLVKALLEGGEDAAARLALRLGGERAEQAKALAYRLYTICERRGWTDEALAYNTLVVSWPAIQQKMVEFAARPAVQVELSL
ncbi:protein of unknown function DUF1156 [Thermosinus carboxydivorans Nor1]|uniref:DUF1156 domain-containing protein n=1 Tax=Thermosinus carboxydivorans Nor1 TaxID=401526 RepID=A1HMM9_9FIRM|nr:DUF1156 domain-containing protein [Thermosinus carboxydivorans]EAX48519.1 protein of unknown function DUF1156 [Thermosinus carboxydivorans Nor1]